MSEGWKCPVCGRGVAPSEKVCEHGAAHGGIGVPIHPNMIPMGPPPIEPRMPSFTGDPYRPPYEITCGGIESTSIGTLWNCGAGHGG